MRWTRRSRRTNVACADGEVMWSWHPDAGVKLRGASRDDGGKKARSPGRARRTPLKPLRGECRMIRLNLCGSFPMLFYARGPWVRPSPGIPCALSIQRVERTAKLGRDRAARTRLRILFHSLTFERSLTFKSDDARSSLWRALHCLSAHHCRVTGPSMMPMDKGSASPTGLTCKRSKDGRKLPCARAVNS